MKRSLILILGLMLVASFLIGAKKKDDNKSINPFNTSVVSGLEFRSIGPALTSGRIADFAVNPTNKSEYYVGVASGNVWKTNNSGTTWTPIFDKYGSYSIASVVIDPNNTNVVWVGTGEYNSQRAIGYGDGVYRSADGGKTFQHVGLKKSEHIGRIVIDPRNSHVYVAAQGPLWGPGGDRGLYKSIDNGKTWKTLFTISENTGFTDIVLDPRNPDNLYAASYQRRRRVYTLVNGGPESAIYKSTDAGATWRKVSSGLPGGNLGRIGLAISPVNPDVVYAIIEAEGKEGGFFRTTDRGESWQRMSNYVSGSPQYYNRIYCDPIDVDKVYSVDVISKVSEDGGKNWSAIGNKFRHVDDHALWIDPTDTEHLLIGGDGGIYETFDRGKNWLYKCNLPVTQFYRVSVDNEFPFYNVYGGTQDNNSLGGPSRTISSFGIVNDDWIVTQGGDGFESQIDPKDPNIVYAQSQHGGLARYDRKSSESIEIQPQPPTGEAYRWNWNSPLIISPHSHTRLYFAANKLFRSDDRGDSWKVISPDLTRQMDRNQLPVMGKIQPPDLPSKNRSTSLFGNIVSLSESPITEGLLYVGTDDGLVQVSENGGDSWRKIESFPGVPKMTYVSFLYASQHHENRVYASFDGRKNSDFKPYILVSDDRGKTWRSLTSDLPVNGTVFTIAEDHVNGELLFTGTEFGAFVTIDGGAHWVQLKGGLPTIPVKDIAIQKRENDLVLATFGRGYYILDDYTPLRELKKDSLAAENILFPVKDAWMFIQKEARYGQGATYYGGKNPQVGAVFTYYLKTAPKTRKQKRKAAEAEAAKKGEPIKYPDFDQFRAEDEEETPFLLFTVTDNSGNVVRRIKAPIKPGINRVVWDFRLNSPEPTGERSKAFGEDSFLALPGVYSVTMGKFEDGKYSQLTEARKFTAMALNNSSLPAPDRAELTTFQGKISELGRVVMGTGEVISNLSKKIELIKTAISNTPAAPIEMLQKARELELRIKELNSGYFGDPTIGKRYGNQPPDISQRYMILVYSMWRTTSAPTQTMKDQFRIVEEEYGIHIATLKALLENLKALEGEMEAYGAPWTPGRIPQLKK